MHERKQYAVIERKQYAVIPPTNGEWAMLIVNTNNARQGGGSNGWPLRYELVAKYSDYTEAIEAAHKMNLSQME